jgi:hypothetical protein
MTLASPDDGKSLERTRLSWRRTTLAGTAAAVLLARLALAGSALVVIALAALLWVAFLVLVQRRISELGQRRLHLRLLMLTSMVCLGLAALGVVVVLG